MRAIPALVVSGFLGSGKTTLVRRLLAEAQRSGQRVAFISNELGAVGVDRALVGGGTDTFVELAGGCVCCALNDALYDTLIALKASVDPDRFVIETSGAAVPHDVQITFYQPPVRDWISEEAVVVVVDADQVLEGRDLDGVFPEQIESADLVLLNKADLVPAEALPALSATVAAMNPGVPVLPCVSGDVDLRLLFAETARAPADGDAAPGAEGHAHAHDHDLYRAAAITVPAGQSAASVEALLRGQGALRIKGFVQLDSGLALVQGVGRRLEMLPADPPADPALVGQVVVIRRRP